MAKDDAVCPALCCLFRGILGQAADQHRRDATMPGDAMADAVIAKIGLDIENQRVQDDGHPNELPDAAPLCLRDQCLMLAFQRVQEFRESVIVTLRRRCYPHTPTRWPASPRAVFASVWKRVTAMVEPAACV